jgi:hypothetical protein
MTRFGHHPGYTVSFSVGHTAGTLTAIAAPDGALQEVLLRVGNHGSTVAGLTEALATGISTALSQGVPLTVLADALGESPSVPAARTCDPEIPRASSVPDYVVRRLSADFPRGRVACPGDPVKAVTSVQDTRSL